MSFKTKKESRKREDAIAHDFNGRRVVASGALWNRKGDATTDEFLFEDKFTKTTDAYSVKSSILTKIYKEALFHRKAAVFRFGKHEREGYIIVSEVFLTEDIKNFGRFNENTYVGKKSIMFNFINLDKMFDNYDIAEVKFDDTITYYMMTYGFFLKNWKEIITL